MIELESLLKLAVDKMASDIFLSVGVAPTLKIHGTLSKVNDEVLTKENTNDMVKKLFNSESEFEKFIKNGEKDFATSLTEIGRFRVAAYIQRGSIAAAIRVLRYEDLDINQLNIPQEILDFHKKTKGLILITGPTGSGKSTTLSAIISLINKNRACHILTLEDPIEYLHKHDKSIVDQREIGIDTNSYSRALKSALRQAPDVIFIGEMRDYETISIALTAAETGHLVLSTLHTTSSAKTIDRIIDVFDPAQQQQIRMQLSTVLSAVSSVQLIPDLENIRIPVFEVMIPNSNIRSLIREGKIPQIEAAIQTGRSDGMISMDMSIAKLYNQGKITKEIALEYSVNKESIVKFFNT